MPDDNFVVLLAEDSEHDIAATKRAWKKNGILNPLKIVHDGQECLDYLYQRGDFSDPTEAPRPKVLLLDLHMPKVDGMEVLRQIRADEKLRNLPVVILTTSKAEEDRVSGYDLGVNAYIVKPVGFDNFAKAISNIHLFWRLVEESD